MDRMLTPDDLQTTIDKEGIDAQLISDIGDTPTVPAAAQALGVEPEQIIKTLLFLVQVPDADERVAVLVISNGEGRVDKGIVTSRYGVGKKRAKLAPVDTVLELLGYPAGGVPPFGHRTRVPVIIDASVLALAARHDGVIFGGGGDDKTMMRLTVGELARVTQADCVDRA